MNGAPLGYLEAAGPRAQTILPLTWFTLIVSIAVCVIIGVLLYVAMHRSTANGGRVETRSVPIARGGNGLRWISVGVAVSAVPLVIALVWTLLTLSAVAGPPPHPALILEVTGHQWWWEVRYDADRPSDTFTTANEIHIPVGVPVLVRLHGGDVIHSFWVPKLTGKTDTIPGQTNVSWLQADQPGVYRGQCGEFCGFQHAHMAFDVIAEPPADFARWQAGQRQGAPAPARPEEVRGLALVEYRCGLCHQVRGTDAGAVSGPDLTHLMSRRMLAAGTLANNPGNLVGWMQDPQGIKPGTQMPEQYLSSRQLSDVLAYLETLK